MTVAASVEKQQLGLRLPQRYLRSGSSFGQVIECLAKPVAASNDMTASPPPGGLGMDRLSAASEQLLWESRDICETPPPPGESTGSETRPTPQERVARIVRTIESDIIPRLVQAHRAPSPSAVPGALQPQPVAVPTEDDVARFVALVLSNNDDAALQQIAALRRQRATIESLYVDLLAPAARLLGNMWEDDDCTFSDVTVAVGRLQRLMRQLSPEFGTEVALPADGRRALLLPAPGEQHTFGLSMVADFFRRAGWDVVCEMDTRTVDPVRLVRGEWFDVVGISAGVDAREDWLKAGIAAVRLASRNRAIGVMVGGPIFSPSPERAIAIGADATATDGRLAPLVAERLLNERARRIAA